LTTSAKVRSAVHESSFWHAYGRARYTILFCALLLTLVVMPIATTLGLSTVLIKLLLTACLFAAVMPNATKRTRYVLLAAVSLLVVTRLAAEQAYLPLNSALMLALVGVTGLACAAGALRFMVKAETVNRETIFAALSTYLLAGIFFGQIYWSMEQIRPGSMSGPDELSELSAVYYSFVTIATLGYGDFLPRSDLARGIATFEVIGGQLYLAVLVARLIGAFDASRR
jgi:Ion channel